MPCLRGEYGNPHSRRHHAQTIACHTCGPGLRLMDKTGTDVPCSDPIREAAALLDAGKILAIRGVGGFHLACIEESSGELKSRLGRIEQPFAVMVRPGFIDQIALVSQDERELLESPYTRSWCWRNAITHRTTRSATFTPSAACSRIPGSTTSSSRTSDTRS